MGEINNTTTTCHVAIHTEIELPYKHLRSTSGICMPALWHDSQQCSMATGSTKHAYWARSVKLAQLKVPFSIVKSPPVSVQPRKE